jgi:hypothetical protein
VSKSRKSAFLMGSAVLLAASASLFAQSELSLKDIIDKNLQASGGRDKIATIKTYSFRTGTTVYCTGADERLKIATGKQPVVTEVILISPDRAQRNRFNEFTEIGGLEKSIYEFQAKLQAGFFTLIKFAKELKTQGLRSFGPEKMYLLAAQQGDLKISFYVHAQEFWIKRIVLQGYWESGLKYEANYDFGPYQEVDGLRFPASWFASFVGMRGNLFEVQDLKLNPSLEPAFFSSLELNIGQVETGSGFLKGNVLDFVDHPDSLMVTTNWTKKSVDKAGLKSNDRLVLTLGGVETEITYYSEGPPQSQFANGAQILSFNPEAGETAVVIFFKIDFSRFKEKLAPLASLQIRKK